jgi:hypothetical protein
MAKYTKEKLEEHIEGARDWLDSLTIDDDEDINTPLWQRLGATLNKLSDIKLDMEVAD